MMSVVNVISREGIEALLIGGFAVNYYGYTRNTLDVDFMFAADHADKLCQAMRNTGFTNIDRQDLAIFFSRPDSAFRVDFLQVDNLTMQQLLESAVMADFHGTQVKVPALKDLLAMKLFALKSNADKRIHKDLPDIAYLVVMHNIDVESDLLTLCERFADEKIFEDIKNEISRIQS